MSMSAYHGLDSLVESTASAVTARGASIRPEDGDDDAFNGMVQHDQAIEPLARGAQACVFGSLEALARDHERLDAVANEDAAISMLKHQRHEIDGHAALLTANLCMPREPLR